VGIEGEERTDAVVVGVVQQDVAEQSEQREGIQHAPAHGRSGERTNDALAVIAAEIVVRLGVRGRVGEFAVVARGTPAVQAIHAAHDHRSLKGNAEKGVRDAPMMGEAIHRSAQTPEGVEVRHLGGEGHRQRGVRRFAVQPGAREASARQDVRHRLHVCSIAAMVECKCENSSGFG
jgi:hypothetical protein